MCLFAYMIFFNLTVRPPATQYTRSYNNIMHIAYYIQYRTVNIMHYAAPATTVFQSTVHVIIYFYHRRTSHVPFRDQTHTIRAATAMANFFFLFCTPDGEKINKYRVEIIKICRRPQRRPPSPQRSRRVAVIRGDSLVFVVRHSVCRADR